MEDHPVWTLGVPTAEMAVGTEVEGDELLHLTHRKDPVLHRATDAVKTIHQPGEEAPQPLEDRHDVHEENPHENPHEIHTNTGEEESTRPTTRSVRRQVMRFGGISVYIKIFITSLVSKIFEIETF